METCVLVEQNLWLVLAWDKDFSPPYNCDAKASSLIKLIKADGFSYN